MKYLRVITFTLLPAILVISLAVYLNSCEGPVPVEEPCTNESVFREYWDYKGTRWYWFENDYGCDLKFLADTIDHESTVSLSKDGIYGFYVIDNKEGTNYSILQKTDTIVNSLGETVINRNAKCRDQLIQFTDCDELGQIGDTLKVKVN